MRDRIFWQIITDLDKDHQESTSISIFDLIPPEFHNKNLDDYEKRGDGKIVRKDRWEMAIRSIQIFLRDMNIWKTSNNEFEIADVVREVKANLIQWHVFDPEELEDIERGKYLVTAIDESIEEQRLTVLEAYFTEGCFYFPENINNKLSDNFLLVTHFAPLPKPAK